MPTSDFLPFAAGAAANVETQAAYAAETRLLNGLVSGIVPSNLLNKTLRQSSVISAVVAQFIADKSGANSVDDGTTATLEANLILAINSLIVLPRGYISGLALSNNATNPTTQIDIAAGKARSLSGVNDLSIASVFTKTLQATGAWAAGTGNNGLFSGARAANTWYHVFLIRNTTTGATDAGFDVSTIAANIPAGYSDYRRIGSVLTDGSSNILAFIQTRNVIQWASLRTDLSVSAPGATAALFTASVPPGIKARVMFNASLFTSSGTQDDLLFTDPDTVADASTATTAQVVVTAVANSRQNCYIECLSNTSGQIRYQCANGPTGTTASAVTRGWLDTTL